MRLSEDVEYITLQRPLPLALHGYVWPFAVAYAALLGGWVWVFGALEFTELFFIVAAVIGSLNIGINRNTRHRKLGFASLA